MCNHLRSQVLVLQLRVKPTDDGDVFAIVNKLLFKFQRDFSKAYWLLAESTFAQFEPLIFVQNLKVQRVLKKEVAACSHSEHSKVIMHSQTP